MSTTRRAYDLLRGYVNREWERLQGIEETDAERELREAIENPYVPARSERPEPEAPQVDTKEQAHRILGVGPDSPFLEIRQAFVKLNKRSDPTNFPEGSAEGRQAAEIQRRVQWAYSVLTDGMDTTERRFGSLEID